MRQIAVMDLDLMVERLRMVEEFRRAGVAGMTFLDLAISLHVFAFREGGTRQQALVDYLPSSRRTIRDSLARLALRGVIARRDGLYYPAPLLAEVFNAGFERMLARIYRLCDAAGDTRDAT